MTISTQLRKADRHLFKLGKSFELLDKINWKLSTKIAFLKNWRSGDPVLPKVRYPKYNFSQTRGELVSIIKSTKGQGPLGDIVGQTAKSFLTALRMLENIGTKRFLHYSVELYGTPTDKLGVSESSTLRAATRFLKAMHGFKSVELLPAESYCILPETVARRVRAKVKKVFGDEPIEVVTSSQLISKAAAGPKRVRIRNSTCFADHDINQLVQHELLVHTLTLLNGRRQRLKSLGLNSPRTTLTQEGLAVFAEFITNAIDVSRLRRISARVRAIQMGLDGADFLDIFKFFLEEGQDENEAYYSAARIFRGGQINGGVVFTKDVVYLRGFIEIHHFLMTALKTKKYLYPHYLFAGRFDVKDIPFLEPYFEVKVLSSPHFEPAWVKNRSTLLAFLLSSSVMDDLGLSRVR